MKQGILIQCRLVSMLLLCTFSIFAVDLLLGNSLDIVLALIAPDKNTDWLTRLGILRGVEITLLLILRKGHVLSTLGVHSPSDFLKQALTGVVIAVIGGVSFLVLSQLSSRFFGVSLVNQAREAFALFADTKGGAQTVRVILVAVLIAPFAEEFFFRGILFRIAVSGGATLKVSFLPLLFSAFLFVIPHLPGGGADSATLLFMVATWTSCAVGAIVLRRITGGMIAGTILHSAGNLGLFIASISG